MKLKATNEMVHHLTVLNPVFEYVIPDLINIFPLALKPIDSTFRRSQLKYIIVETLKSHRPQ